MAKVNYGSLPFKEAINFFKEKTPLPTAAWTDIWQEQHDVNFVVAGAMQADVLNDFHKSITRLRTQGGTLRDLRKDFDAIVDKHGWGYNGGRNWRTRVIYDTNMRQSYNAGQYRQQIRAAKSHPWWRYRHSIASVDPRPKHLKWDGLILRHDDPWWNSHYPQNGWGCKCFVESLAERDMQRLGKSGPDTAPEIEWEEKTVGTRGPSPRVVKVPKGIDPGFAYTPGKSRLESSLEMFSNKAESVPSKLADKMINRVVESKTFERWYQNPTGTFPVARLPDEDASLIGAKQHIVGLSEQTAKKQLKQHAELLAAEYLAIQACISRGERIQDSSRSLVYILDEADGHVSVVKSTRSGEGLFLSSFRRLSKAQAKRDSEINRLRRTGGKK